MPPATCMTELDNYRELFDKNLPLIEKLLATIARRMALRGDDAEEFGSRAMMRLWDDDCAILRKWQGRSKLATYLVVVLTNLAHELRIERDGRWRPSSAARRLGRVAIIVEKCCYYHGMRIDEVGEWLRTRGDTMLTDRELATLLHQLPVRTRRRHVDDSVGAVASLPGDDSAEDVMVAEEMDAERRDALGKLDEALGRLPPREQTVIRMHFFDGLTLADVARALNIEQMPLYRVKDQALKTLRRDLSGAGLTPRTLQEIMGGAFTARDDFPDTPSEGNVKPPVSSPSNQIWDSRRAKDVRAASDTGEIRRREE